MYRNEKIDELMKGAGALIETRVDLPKGYAYKSCNLVNHDAVPVFIFRYEKANGENAGYGGENFSVSIDMNVTRVMGFMHVDGQHCGPGLPDEDESKKIAIETIEKLAPDLIGQYEIKWVLPLQEKPVKIPHEIPFPFTDDSRKIHLVTGVRVKLFFAKLNSWGWVIVGRQGKVIAFEREITWNTIMNKRSTPAWLHDPFVLDLHTDITNGIKSKVA